ncbi:MAG: transketolase [Alphaproteobacteria bacterium]|nr:transketolase [Alphaproteobacteria bacterium]
MALAQRKPPHEAAAVDRLALLHALERKALWLSTWMIHHANHLRPNHDGLKVGGHQASCASAVTLLTALYFHALRPEDRIAVKPHAAPVLHAIQYLLGRQSRAALENFRALGGAQSYPSRTKDTAPVDFSTGSVGLGVGMTLFAALTQDYVRLHRLGAADRPAGRMVAVMGDAELDEGNVFEALLEGWKQDVRNLWWIIDYNRQSLDGVVNDYLFQKIQQFFATVGWKVVTLKYGKRLGAVFARPGGAALRRWIDECPNDLYSALTFQGGSAWRARLAADLGAEPGIAALLAAHDDQALHDLMTNLAGHDMAALVDAFDAAANDETPHCFVAYTVKGRNLPLAGHKDNHAGLMNPAQMEAFRATHAIPAGAEWDPYAGLDVPAETLRAFLAMVPLAHSDAAARTAALPMPAIGVRLGETMSTQEGFGRIMTELGRDGSEFVRRVVTCSPDVTVSTNLGGWVNHAGVFARQARPDVFREQHLPSVQKWLRTPAGRHIELGIAENNLFLLLASLGLSEVLFGARLLPVGTLYDPFVARGLDALNYACYQDARFMLAATPSGVTLAPEGGAHQSVVEPLIGMGQPGLTYFEPAFVDELHAAMAWGFAHMQEDDGGSVYLRLSTRAITQPQRNLTDELRAAVAAGGYWLKPPQAGGELAVVAMGAVLPEAIDAVARLGERNPRVGLMVVTSPDRLYADWQARGRHSHAARLLAPLGRDAALVSVLDGHPLTLAWLGTVRGQRIKPLGVSRFGQSGDIPDLYRTYGIDAAAIAAAAEAALDGAR